MPPKNQPEFLRDKNIVLRVKIQITELCFAVDYYTRGGMTADFCKTFDRFLELTEDEGYKNGTLDRSMIVLPFYYRTHRPQLIFDTINELIAILAKTENDLARDILCTAFKSTVLLEAEAAAYSTGEERRKDELRAEKQTPKLT